MHCTSGVLLWCFLTIASNPAAFADAEDNSEEVGADQEIKSTSSTLILETASPSSGEGGIPDSHEAMNNRMMIKSSPKTAREKRSYEFLMGLVNNNSKYEVTKIDPSSPKSTSSQGTDSNATASELLLELMVKIAAHPDHWDKVHKLLQKIDSDLLASKKIVEDLQNAKIKTESNLLEDISAPIPMKKEERNKNDSRFAKNEWPSFDSDEEEPPNTTNDKVSFMNTASTENYRWQNSPQHKSIYPKAFAYHRVTGRPLYLNKNPKAYIAVSVIAPKPISTRSQDEDLSLEKELRQLKPWTHNQNLKNMASIRSRWVIQTDDKKDPVSP